MPFHHGGYEQFVHLEQGKHIELHQILFLFVVRILEPAEAAESCVVYEVIHSDASSFHFPMDLIWCFFPGQVLCQNQHLHPVLGFYSFSDFIELLFSSRYKYEMNTIPCEIQCDFKSYSRCGARDQCVTFHNTSSSFSFSSIIIQSPELNLICSSIPLHSDITKTTEYSRIILQKEFILNSIYQILDDEYIVFFVTIFKCT